jgi:thiosulfate sulfurtransferase
MNIPEIDLEAGLAALESGKTTFLDIRRPNDRAMNSIPGSAALSDANVEDFIRATPKDQSLVVFCYHGISSRGATAYLLESGFTDVKSLRGGFEGWHSAGHPTTRGVNS